MLQNVKRRVEPAAGPMDWTTRKVLVWLRWCRFLGQDAKLIPT